MAMWFPRPSVQSDVLIVSTGGLGDCGQLFKLLCNPDAVEWQDKVGVVGPVEGSAKTTTRLLVSGGWVLKTSVAGAIESESTQFAAVKNMANVGAEARLWHPDKSWGIFRNDNKWYAVNATPRLQTLREICEPAKKMQAWTNMMEFATGVALKSGLGLDLNPANFGTVPGSDRLYYLDDEWYPKVTFLELGSAIVARIPEEPEIGNESWTAWGRVLASILGPLCQTHSDWESLFDNVDAHPLASQFEVNRIALLDGLQQAENKRRKLLKKSKRLQAVSQRTAVIGDVHGNLDALDAVLQECKEHNIDSYIFVGDAIGYGPNPKECVGRLAELPNAQFIRGNHDHAIGSGVLRDGMNHLARSCAHWTLDQLSIDDREWLMSLPVDIRDANWLAVHGAPKDPRRFFAYVYELTYEENLEHLSKQQVQLCFYGHTHVQFIHEKTVTGSYEKLGAPASTALNGGGIFLVNPGSIGQPRDRDTRAAYALWDRKRNSISLRRVTYKVSSVVEKIRKFGLPSSLGERLLQGV